MTIIPDGFRVRNKNPCWFEIISEPVEKIVSTSPMESLIIADCQESYRISLKTHLSYVLMYRNQDNIYLFKVSYGNSRKRCEICSELVIKTPERRYWRRSGVFIEHISQLFPLFLLLTLNEKMLTGEVLDANGYRAWLFRTLWELDLALNKFHTLSFNFFEHVSTCFW